MKKRFAPILCVLMTIAVLLSACSPAPGGGDTDTAQSSGSTERPGGNTTERPGGNTTEGETDGIEDDTVLNMTGKQAAELLLAGARLDENKINKKWLSFTKSTTETKYSKLFFFFVLF